MPVLALHPEWHRRRQPERWAGFLARCRWACFPELIFRISKFGLTSQTCNHIVTHYAEPFGYIFAGGGIQCFGRSHPPRCTRSVAQRQPACRTDCFGVSCLKAGNFQAFAFAAQGSSGRGTPRRPASRLPVESPTAPRGGYVAGAVSGVLADESG